MTGKNVSNRLVVASTNLRTLEWLESLTSLGSLVVGYESQFGWDELGNAELVSLKGLENLRELRSLQVMHNPKLADITALAGIPKLSGNLVIVNNGSLASLEGLHNLTEVRDTKFEALVALVDLSGLRSLEHANSRVFNGNSLVKNFKGLENVTYLGSWSSEIRGNSALEDFTGFEKLCSIAADFSVANNPKLTSLRGLEALDRFGWLVAIRNNPELASIEALSGVTEIRSDITVIDNPKLPQCQVERWLSGLSKTCECSGNGAGTCP